jgi:Dyp-type peroxidase family
MTTVSPASGATQTITSMEPPAREAPAPVARPGGNDDMAHQPLPNEPVLDVDHIQGNILAGFNKDNQMLLFLRVDDPAGFRTWLAAQVPFVASLKEVLAFNRLFKTLRARRGVDAGSVKATWMNIAFSHAGLVKLATQIPGLLDADFVDTSFVQGLAAQSANLGDPTDPTAEGNPANWLVGGPSKEADVVVIVAADDPADLAKEVNRIEQGLQATAPPAVVIFKQPGATLLQPMTGHEHFGFLDGVSQPGVRGRVSADPHDVLTIRQNPLKRDNKATGGDVAQGKPGQDLLWPGEFVFGYLKQNGDPVNGDIDVPSATPADAGPPWAKNGSFLVFRRLRQDVFEFHRFLKQRTADQSLADPNLLDAKIVSRWQSGAPVMRTGTAAGSPEVDIPALGMDDCANNDFEFQEASSPITTADVQTSFDCTDDTFPTSPGDHSGAVCPFSAHVRKAYPRDDVDPDVPPLSEVTTQTHRLIRRGIPWGPVSPSTPTDPVQDNVDRGLVFIAYQTSIINQFEFMTQNWINNPDFKHGGTGFDPLIDQNPNDPNRVRTFVTVVKGSDNQPKTLTLDTTGFHDWVIPTGGGYFFSPGIDVLANVLGKS